MIVAHVNDRPAFATKGARGFCPGCADEVIARVGEILRPHWAHRPGPLCEYDSKGESPWHAGWKYQCVDPGRVEHADGHHRADVITPSGMAIEFQHSPIEPQAIRSRERHWERGCWVYDGSTENGRRLRMKRHPDRPDDDNYRVLDWERPNLLITRATWPVWVDLPDSDCMFRIGTVRTGHWVTGSGWVVSRAVFTDGILNGYGLNPERPRPGKPWHPAPITEPPPCTYLRCTNGATHRMKPSYGVAWQGCDEHWPNMFDALHVGMSNGGSVTLTKISWR